MQVSRENLPQFLDNSWCIHTARDLTNLLICNSKIQRLIKSYVENNLSSLKDKTY